MDMLKLFKISLLTGAALALTACSGEDDPVNTPTGTGNNSDKAYVSIAIKPELGTGGFLDSFWQCSSKMTVDDGNVQSFHNSGPFKYFENGTYTLDLEVNCGCTVQSCNKPWAPVIRIPNTDLLLKSAGVNLLQATVRITVENGVLNDPTVVNHTPVSLKPGQSIKKVSYSVLSTASDDSNEISCSLQENNAQAHYGGFGFHNVEIENIGTETINRWRTHIDFGAGTTPDPQWAVNGQFTVNSSHSILMQGDDSLAPGEKAYFSVGGNFQSDDNIVDVSCY